MRLTVAPVTGSPGALSTGTDSPVMADSSTDAAPATTTPSTGTPSPARTANTSPSRTSSARICSWVPSADTRTAVLGARSMSVAMASVVRPFARASKYLPSVMSVRIMAALSKYRSMPAACAPCTSPAPSA